MFVGWSVERIIGAPPLAELPFAGKNTPFSAELLSTPKFSSDIPTPLLKDESTARQ